ncbi:class I SAM-dependent methyltransferase [Nitratidesulfovibrio sp. D1]|uniref:class I SAM-dependent methyltransferase n=1 Tax=Nitratidesulfovibrio sp. D1 TaxID=3440151 RepID=UPI003EB81565
MVRKLVRRLCSVLPGAREEVPNVQKRIRLRLEAMQDAGRPVLCNLGCGRRHNPAWINIDFHGDGDNVLPWDLRRGLPLPDGSCDVVYSSHVIEHFDRHGGRRFLDECRRVLKPGGILRLVAPDLEGVARSYLSCLEAVRRGEPGAAERYEWIVIEMLDQLVRHRSGGEMLEYWSGDTVLAEDFVAARVGTEYYRARAHCKNRKIQPASIMTPTEIGLFRVCGEVHQWMYDSYSLEKLLGDSGFIDIMICDANRSSITDFASYNLDTEPDGSIYKPDSFFTEAKAP